MTSQALKTATNNVSSHIVLLGKPSCKKNGKKSGQCPYGGGLPQFIHFSLILPGPQITWKWTMHTDKLTTKCHICLHTWKQGGLMCGIWDWQSTIVKDLNDSQDPKHTLFCREIVFVAIYALFSDNKCPLFRGEIRPKRTMSAFFYRFSYMRASLTCPFFCLTTLLKIFLSWASSNHLTVEGWNEYVFSWN